MIHKLGDAYRSVVSAVTPQSTESKFISEGKLTPDEFVAAGDQLCFKFPSWEWAKGQDGQMNSYLPADKQYLVTRRVPCKDRVRALDYVLEHKTKTEDDWLLPETATGNQEASGGVLQDIGELAGTGGPMIVAEEDFLSNRAADAGAALPDFSDLDACLADGDPVAAAGATGESAGEYFIAEAPDDTMLKMRKYDLSITYDKYYQCPRLWLFGYDSSDIPLQPEKVFEDVLTEYREKTVTVDPHPHEVTPTVSIHPCKHTLVMKKVVDDWIAQDITPNPQFALFVFLKFISGVVPTINYDFTMDIEF